MQQVSKKLKLLTEIYSYWETIFYEKIQEQDIKNKVINTNILGDYDLENFTIEFAKLNNYSIIVHAGEEKTILENLNCNVILDTEDISNAKFKDLIIFPEVETYKIEEKVKQENENEPVLRAKYYEIKLIIESFVSDSKNQKLNKQKKLLKSIEQLCKEFSIAEPRPTMSLDGTIKQNNKDNNKSEKVNKDVLDKLKRQFTTLSDLNLINDENGITTIDGKIVKNINDEKIIKYIDEKEIMDIIKNEEREIKNKIRNDLDNKYR